MLNENSVKILEEKLKNEDFLNKLFELESQEEVVEMFKSEGMSISIEEVNSIRNLIIKKLNDKDELDDSELEEVSGGIVGSTAIAIFGVIAAVFGGGTFVSKVTNRRW